MIYCYLFAVTYVKQITIPGAHPEGLAMQGVKGVHGALRGKGVWRGYPLPTGERGLGGSNAHSPDFYRATACNATHGIAIAILSVRPSVYLSDACVVTKLNDGLRIF